MAVVVCCAGMWRNGARIVMAGGEEWCATAVPRTKYTYQQVVWGWVVWRGWCVGLVVGGGCGCEWPGGERGGGREQPL